MRAAVQASRQRINIRAARVDQGFLIGSDVKLTDASGEPIPGVITAVTITARPFEPVHAELRYVLTGVVDFADVPATFWPDDEAALRAAADRLGFDIVKR